MRPYYQTPDVTIYHGDARQVLAELPEESVMACVTSPPYYSLRKYQGVEPSIWGGDPNCEHSWSDWEETDDVREETISGKTRTTERFYGSPSRRFDGNHQKHTAASECSKCGAQLCCLGLEKDPASFVAHLVEVFRGVKRVLRRDGTCWVNLGDSYSGSGKGPQGNIPSKAWDNDDAPRGTSAPGVPAKSAICIPDRFRLAMLDDGWIVRVRSVPWVKRSCMPGSQTDRPTIATEDWMMFTKSGRYYWDAEAVRRENKTAGERHEGRSGYREGHPNHYGFDHRELNPNGRALRTTDAYFDSLDLAISETRRTLAHLERVREQGGLLLDDDGEPLALDVVSKGSDREHYASYPEEIVKPFVLAGTSEHGHCATCGKGWERIIDYKPVGDRGKVIATYEDHGVLNRTMHPGPHNAVPKNFLGWAKACTCPTDERTADLKPDDMEIIETPTGERVGDDPSIFTGRAGFNRPRGDKEGKRQITRYEQRRYAAQLRQSAHKALMAQEAGSAFDHYLRTDRSGARPIPADLLERWIERGWLVREQPPSMGDAPRVPGTILDPFLGSGTTAVVARQLGRRAVGVDASLDYCAMARDRIEETTPHLPIVEESAPQPEQLGLEV